MMDSFFLAWKYLSYHRGKTFILITCITLIAVLPIALEMLLTESQRQLLSRANSTPLLIGSKGSALDLVMNNLYFGEEISETISMTQSQEVFDSELAVPIPVYVRFKARGFPVVGVTLDYFDFRELRIDEGRQIAILGEAVLGAAAAEKLELGPGDSLVTTPETVFDLAGIYPLKLEIVGVLAPQHPTDDLAVFVDLKTAWVVQGLGHGHDDLAKTQDSSVILKKSNGNIVANAKLVEHNEITPGNLDSFHFHGDQSIYPLSGIIAVPKDHRSETILRGRYQVAGEDTPLQITRPIRVVENLLDRIYQIKNVLDAVIYLVGLATILAIILVFSLSLRLRERELATNFKIGCSKLMTVQLVIAEISIIVLLSALICGLLLLLVNNYSSELVRSMVV